MCVCVCWAWLRACICVSVNLTRQRIDPEWSLTAQLRYSSVNLGRKVYQAHSLSGAHTLPKDKKRAAADATLVTRSAASTDRYRAVRDYTPQRGDAAGRRRLELPLKEGDIVKVLGTFCTPRSPFRVPMNRTLSDWILSDSLMAGHRGHDTTLGPMLSLQLSTLRDRRLFE